MLRDNHWPFVFPCKMYWKMFGLMIVSETNQKVQSGFEMVLNCLLRQCREVSGVYQDRTNLMWHCQYSKIRLLCHFRYHLSCSPDHWLHKIQRWRDRRRDRLSSSSSANYYMVSATRNCQVRVHQVSSRHKLVNQNWKCEILIGIPQQMAAPLWLR